MINYLSQSAETLAEFTLAVNPPAGSSYTGTLKIDKEYSGYVVVNGDKSAISDIKYNKNDQLAFTTTINGQLLQFSGFHKPDQKDHNYAGIFLNTSGKAVSQLAAGLGFRLIIVDDREEYADPERFPEAEQTIVADFSNGLTDLPINQNTYILVATRGHRFDDIATAAAVDSPARYVGLLGSKRKSLMIYKNLAEKGISVERIQEIRSPVGVDIGALTPSELAVSIMAEIIAIRRGGSGGFMKMDMPPNGKRQ